MSYKAGCEVYGCGCAVPEVEKVEASHRHEWTEDGATFAVVEDSNYVAPDVFGLPRLILEGPRFPHTFPDSGEAPLAREILRLSRLSQGNEELAADNLCLTDRVNALTARIEEALDLILEKTEDSGKVAEAYRKLERVLLAGTKEVGSKGR